MVKKLSWLGFLLLPVFAHAAGPLFELKVEPLVGYERVQKLLPTPHSRDRMFFGGRAVLGLPLFSGELEYQRAYDEEAFTAPSQTVRDTDDRARVGLRSSIGLGRLVRFHARAGAQGLLNRREVIVGGTSTVTNTPLAVYPYAGAGLRISMGSRFSLSADATVAFRQWNDMSQNEYQVAAGFAVRLP